MFTFKVVAHSGTVVRINKKGNAFHISSSKLDTNQVEGILGDLNNNAADDFFINGTSYRGAKLNDYFDLYE